MLAKGWTTDQSSWEKLGSMIGELVWHPAPLNHDSLELVHSVKGVYFITSAPPIEPHTTFPVQLQHDNTNILYAGRSDADIRARFAQHAGPEPQSGVKEVVDCYGSDRLMFYWTDLSGMSNNEIHEIEDAIVTCFGPPGNKNRPIRASVTRAISLG